MLALWLGLLPVETLGIHTNFFNVGGNSLLATQLVNRINQQFKTAMTIQMLLEKQTVAQLSGQIELLTRLQSKTPITVGEDDLEEMEF